MFLTKKSLRKVLIMVIVYIAVGTLCLGGGILLKSMGASPKFLFVLCGICYAFCPLIFLIGRYAEGKGMLINSANKLFRTELKPLEFIKEYEKYKNADNLVINKPNVDVLRIVALAYFYAGDKENCLATIDEIVSVCGEKKKALALLVKASYLYTYQMKEEAEELFWKASDLKLDAMEKMLHEGIIKCDRAMANGDYNLAEAYCLQCLNRTFPKPDNLIMLDSHYTLGVIYDKMQDKEKAIFHYEYCAMHGGETFAKNEAKIALERLR